MEIPKIIHQTWKSDLIPLKCKNWVKSWKEKHRGGNIDYGLMRIIVI